MKKRVLLCCAALLALVCASAGATDWEFSDRDRDGTYDAESAVYIQLSGDGVFIDGDGATAEGSAVTIADEGVYVLSGTLSDGRVIVNAGEDDKVQIVLAGADIHCETYAALYVEEADKVFLTLEDGTQNRLSCGAEFALASEDDNVDATVFSRADLTLNGAGSLAIEGNYDHGLVSKDDLVITGGEYSVSAVGHGLVGKDCVKISGGSFAIAAGGDGIQSDNDEDEALGFIYITGGTFSLEAANDAIQAETQLVIEGGTFALTSGGGSTGETAQSGGWPSRGGWDASSTATEDTPSTKGLKAGTLLRVADGDFTIDALDDALHSGGDLTIDGGAFAIATDDNGAHADGALTVNGGTLSISRSFEGLEGSAVTINGGDISIVSSDDGINSAGGSDEESESGRDFFRMFEETGCDITVNGGYILIDAGGDGIDANGSIYMNGGEVYVNGPTSGADSALDWAGECVASGGTMVAVGSAGMAQGFSESSTQGAILVNASGAAGETLELVDEAGNVLVSFAPTKAYSSVALTAPGLAVGQTYSLRIGGTEAVSISMESTVYSEGGFGGFGGGRGGERSGGNQGDMPTAPDRGEMSTPPDRGAGETIARPGQEADGAGAA
ncbi:MAG TPA: carbohydrate-binding domain-containing protein [Candidatus Alectryocaccomicrobium excrementavium]|uniref:Carbohydrate-binding domain-containing protein n=1 Tax=Candidatus Alectryocaccomicrobium excrementavium TaxID=2840668 RepID=A0A9D1K5D2_9FIRM|nr:carbohydrate-binding domain-containing protein [Candidatus Alectryocaccomicrobium excrementavium]